MAPQPTLSNRRCCLRTYFSGGHTILDGFNSLPLEHPEGESVADRFRKELYFLLLKKMLSELKKRFTDQACGRMINATAVYYRYRSPLGVTKVKSFVKFYSFALNQVGQQHFLFLQSNNNYNWKQEFEQHSNRLVENERYEVTLCMFLSSLLKLFEESNLCHLYNGMFRIITTVAPMQVTMASCERTRSKTNILNNYLRSSMSSERLQDLVQINSERDIADNIKLEKLIEIFNSTSQQRIRLCTVDTVNDMIL